MQLLLVTTVDEYRKIILRLFDEVEVSGFSVMEIEGFSGSKFNSATWFPAGKAGKKSLLLFSFTVEAKIEQLIRRIEEFNRQKDNYNPIHLAVLPIETFI